MKISYPPQNLDFHQKMWINPDLHNIMHIMWIKKWITKYKYYIKVLESLYFVDFLRNICNRKLSTFL